MTQIHGGPHTLYGWSPIWEFQILAADGIGVFYCNPRGSEGYGEAFNDANHRDWGPGPMRDVLAGVDVARRRRPGRPGAPRRDRRLVRRLPDQLDRRPRRPLRGGDDLPLASATWAMLFLTGDISGGEWAKLEFEATPWEDPAYFREISPISLRRATSRRRCSSSTRERDIRTTIGQAEALFTVLRSLKRPVRLLRVPEETHELTRSGTPYRRVENLEIVRDWFAPLPRRRASAGCRRSPRSAAAAEDALAARRPAPRPLERRGNPGVSSPSHDGHQARSTAPPASAPTS